MIIQFLQKHAFTRNYVSKLGHNRSLFLIHQFEQYLKKGDRLLDIGSGTCNIVDTLQKTGYDVTALDIDNLSFIPAITPELYDGKKIPYPDKHFDVSLIITVLHHTTNSEQIIKEAARVASKIIIIEDIYANNIQKYLTYFLDSLLNLEFRGHPHANRTDQAWKELFLSYGYKLSHTSYAKTHGVLHHVIYEVGVS